LKSGNVSSLLFCHEFPNLCIYRWEKFYSKTPGTCQLKTQEETGDEAALAGNPNEGKRNDF